jgi:PKD repeat protein
MTIPTEFISSKYPEELDSNTNLFLVHDSLRVVLAEDYDPSLTNKIFVSGDISMFPQTGIITLTEQCSDPKDRAVSFFYKNKTIDSFEELTVLPGFKNEIIRKKQITNVTQNVMSHHHNSLKDALIAIETFVGVKGTTDNIPFGETMEGRINFLRKLVLSPKAWFSANKRIGLAPLEIEFKNESFRLSSGEVKTTWNFGDQEENEVSEIYEETIIKTYTNPGNFDVTLIVENEYGTDTIVFEKFINVRSEAPLDAVVDFSNTNDQIYISGTRILNNASEIAGPWEVTPKIKSKINKIISMSIDLDSIYLDENEIQRNNAGEELDLNQIPIDPIEEYEWILNDDLIHANENFTDAAYSIGGVYDLVLKTKTRYNSFKITKYSEAIDIIEDKNMFLFTLNGLSPISHEFGLISEEFKTGIENDAINLDFNNSFLDGTYDEEKAKFELKRNVGFSKFNTILSGFGGTSIITYATGGTTSDVTTQKAKILNFSGFSGLLTTDSLEVNRPWNWIFLNFTSKAYYLFGTENANPQSINTTSYQYKDTLLLGNSLNLGTGTPITEENYLNGANDLGIIPNVNSEPKWSVNRSTVKDNTGYILRNESVGLFFRLKSFYRTEGTSEEPVINFRKIQDITGQVKTEGQLVNMSNGIFFFNNSGSVSAYNLIENKWEILSINSNVFKNFQDTLTSGYDNKDNTLLVTSDGERVSYLSYDYSNKSFIKFNSIESTFTKLNPRPEGEQWLLTIY